jgi:O-antigen/teichoic acid export membrane protein
LNRLVTPPLAPHLREWLALLSREKVVAHNVVVGASTIAAGFLGVAFQSLVSHRLQPSDYGAVFAVVSLITFVGLPATAFTLLMAREASRDRASGLPMASVSLLQRGNRLLLITGLAIATVLVVSSPVLVRFLGVPTNLVTAAAAGIPFGLALPLLMGEFQGEQRFLAFAGLSTGQASLKLLGAVALGSIWGPVGIIAGISFASAATYLVAIVVLRHKLLITSTAAWWGSAVTYLAVVLPSTLALAVLLSADVLLVKHFFPSRAAGEYAAIAAMGRAVFWGASGVATVLFPKVVFRGAKGLSGSKLVSASLFLVGLGGLASLVLLAFGSRWLVVAFAGAAYGDAAVYLPWYAVGMMLLGAAAVLIATHQSIGRPAFLAVLIPLTALEPVLLILFHQSLWQMVWVVNISMALVAVGLGCLYVIQERVQVSRNVAASGTAPVATNLAELG